jgi:hypothetical protein
VARALAAGGFIGGIGKSDPQNAYANYKHGGKTYDLLWVSSKQGMPLGLHDLLIQLGWNHVGSGAAVNKASVIITKGGNGSPYGHVVVGVGADLIDAHNMARHHVHKSFYQVTTIYHPPGKDSLNATDA